MSYIYSVKPQVDRVPVELCAAVQSLAKRFGWLCEKQEGRLSLAVDQRANWRRVTVNLLTGEVSYDTDYEELKPIVDKLVTPERAFADHLLVALTAEKLIEEGYTYEWAEGQTADVVVSRLEQWERELT
jgi:hypothetical protein